MPLPKVLPVLLEALPTEVREHKSNEFCLQQRHLCPLYPPPLLFQDDRAEDKVIYQAICSLIKSKNPTVMGALPQVLSTLLRAVSDDSDVDQGVQEEIVSDRRLLLARQRCH